MQTCSSQAFSKLQNVQVASLLSLRCYIILCLCSLSLWSALSLFQVLCELLWPTGFYQLYTQHTATWLEHSELHNWNSQEERRTHLTSSCSASPAPSSEAMKPCFLVQMQRLDPFSHPVMEVWQKRGNSWWKYRWEGKLDFYINPFYNFFKWRNHSSLLLNFFCFICFICLWLAFLLTVLRNRAWDSSLSPSV